MGRLENKVAFITGAARGQGREHAIRFAQEGADIIAVDVCASIDTVPYAGATEGDLAQTVKEVESLGRRIVARQVDVRCLDDLKQAVAEGISEMEHIDIVVANAGIHSFAPVLEISEQMWQDVLDINLTGAWKSVMAAVVPMIERGRGGSVILTSSVAGLAAIPHMAHYVVAKHGVVGLMRALSVEFAPHSIRVNSVHPTTVDTAMVANPAMYELVAGGPEGATREHVSSAMTAQHVLPIPWVDPVDISNAALYLASNEARYVTGTTLTVDAGALHPFKIPHLT